MVNKMVHENFAYKGIKGIEGLKAFELQEDKAITQLKNIIDFVIRNKSDVPALDIQKLRAFLKMESDEIKEY